MIGQRLNKLEKSVNEARERLSPFEFLLLIRQQVAENHPEFTRFPLCSAVISEITDEHLEVVKANGGNLRTLSADIRERFLEAIEIEGVRS